MARVRRSSPAARADRRINDRCEEAERLARTGAGRNHEALSRHRFRDGLRLMPIKGDRLPVDPKDASHVGMQQSVRNQRLDRRPPLVMRIDADQRFRPEAPTRVDRIDLISDVTSADLCERASKTRVIRDDGSIEIKDIHEVLAPPTQADSSRAGARKRHLSRYWLPGVFTVPFVCDNLPTNLNRAPKA
jgi:hypothetical protein